METKKCSKCGEIKLVGEFDKDKGRKCGFSCQCKECRRITNKTYRQSNSSVIKNKKKAYSDANKDKISANARAYYHANKGKVKAYQKEYYETNKNEISLIHKSYYESNKSRLRSKQKEYNLINKDKIKTYKEVNKDIFNSMARLKAYNLTDPYICSQLKIPTSQADEYKDLIELKRVQLKIHRLLKK